MTWTWELYRDENDQIPLELLEYFWLMLEDHVKESALAAFKIPEYIPECRLTRQQSAKLTIRIKKLCDFYPRSLSDSEIDAFTEGFFELRLMGQGYSLRFFFVQKHPQTFVFLNVISKKYNGPTRDTDKALAIQRTQKVMQAAQKERQARKQAEQDSARNTTQDAPRGNKRKRT
jgi:phage-related protein